MDNNKKDRGMAYCGFDCNKCHMMIVWDVKKKERNCRFARMVARLGKKV